MRDCTAWTFALAAVLASNLPAADEPLDALMPDDIIGYVRLTGAGNKLDQFLASDLRRELEALEPVKQALAHPKWTEFLGNLRAIEAFTGQDPVKLAKSLLGREALLGARLGFGGPEFLLLARSGSESELAESLQAIRSAVGKQDQPIELKESKRGDHKIEYVEGKLAHARIGATWIVSNALSAVERAVDLRAARSSGSLKASTAFGRAGSAHHSDALIALAVRPQFIPNYHVPDKLDNPLGSILLGGWLGALQSSDLLTASARAGGGALEVKVAAFLKAGAADDKAWEKYTGFFPEVVPTDLRERLEKRGILTFTEIHRNLAQWWEHREELLVTQAVGGLIEFSNTMNIFFSPRSFQDELLPDIGSTIAIVSRNQEYKNLKEAPKPAIPGFAAIFELKNAGESADSMQTAFQSLIAIINLDQANKKKEGMAMRPRVEAVGDVDMHTVTFNTSARTRDAKPGLLHNFTPSMAVAGSRVILSSSAELTRILIEELKGLPAAKTTARRAADTLAIDGAAARSILGANRDVLVAQSMMNKGKSKAEAEAELGLLLDLLKHVRDLRLESARNGDALQVDIKLSTHFGDAATGVRGPDKAEKPIKAAASGAVKL